jgi:hypothetical protein
MIMNDLREKIERIIELSGSYSKGASEVADAEEIISLCMDEAIEAVSNVSPDGGLFPKTPARVRRECLEAIENLKD